MVAIVLNNNNVTRWSLLFLIIIMLPGGRYYSEWRVRGQCVARDEPRAGAALAAECGSLRTNSQQPATAPSLDHCWTATATALGATPLGDWVRTMIPIYCVEWNK